MTPTDTDFPTVHRYFAADCFNRAWDLLDLPTRSREQERQLEALAHASVFHWTQSVDVAPRNYSVGYWQLSRVYAVLGNPSEALRHGQTCLELSQGLEPFYVAYAHEALARGAMLAGDTAAAAAHLAAAQPLADLVEHDASRRALRADLQSIAAATQAGTP